MIYLEFAFVFFAGFCIGWITGHWSGWCAAFDAFGKIQVVVDSPIRKLNEEKREK
jgi:hypothetical protein